MQPGGVRVLEGEHEKHVDALGRTMLSVVVGASAVEIFDAGLQACRHVPEEVRYAKEAATIGQLRSA